MALKRYVGPHAEVSVIVAGVDYGVIKQGGSVSVPDDIAKLVLWSPKISSDPSPRAVHTAKDAGKDNN